MAGSEKHRRADARDPESPKDHQTWFYCGTNKTYTSLNRFYDAVIQYNQKEKTVYWKHSSVVKNDRSRASADVKELQAQESAGNAAAESASHLYSLDRLQAFSTCCTQEDLLCSTRGSHTSTQTRGERFYSKIMSFLPSHIALHSPV
jgi:hypothetical protein